MVENTLAITARIYRQLLGDKRFIALAGQVNGAMPRHVVKLVAGGLNQRRKAVNGSRILVVGVAYKSGIDDVRESPALDIIEMLSDQGAELHWHDPHVPALPEGIRGTRLDELTPGSLKGFDAAVIVTPHAGVDHDAPLDAGLLVVDTRNALKGRQSDDLIKL